MVGFTSGARLRWKLRAMSGEDLAASYCKMARSRLVCLRFFLDRGDHAMVIREAQECVELTQSPPCANLESNQ